MSKIDKGVYTKLKEIAHKISNNNNIFFEDGLDIVCDSYLEVIQINPEVKDHLSDNASRGLLNKRIIRNLIDFLRHKKTDKRRINHDAISLDGFLEQGHNEDEIVDKNLVNFNTPDNIVNNILFKELLFENLNYKEFKILEMRADNVNLVDIEQELNLSRKAVRYNLKSAQDKMRKVVSDLVGYINI